MTDWGEEIANAGAPRLMLSEVRARTMPTRRIQVISHPDQPGDEQPLAEFLGNDCANKKKMHDGDNYPNESKQSKRPGVLSLGAEVGVDLPASLGSGIPSPQ